LYLIVFKNRNTAIKMQITISGYLFVYYVFAVTLPHPNPSPRGKVSLQKITSKKLFKIISGILYSACGAGLWPRTCLCRQTGYTD
jgi:hypothetical protein